MSQRLPPTLSVAVAGVPSDAVVVEEVLPGLEVESEWGFSPLWRPGQDDPDFLRRLGRRMHGYEAELLRSERIMRDRDHPSRPARVPA